ncbi:MAG: cadherin-like beta sandwich domain-containing protein, partial [Cohnella sp.]|nr:cadherin-like beta sandwich domain-containing protein [Cohnella sp.]
DTGINEPNDGIAETNNIFPLKLVTAYVAGNQLKLVFNKPIDGDDAALELAGLTYGGVPVEEPHAVDGHVLTVGLPAGAVNKILAYDAGSGKIQDANNPNVKLGSIVPGIDLGDDQHMIDPDGQLNGLGVSDGGEPVMWDPVFNSAIPNGYRAFLPETVGDVTLNPLDHPGGTIVRAEVNGAGVPANQLPHVPLAEGLNTVTVSVYSDAPLTKDGNPRKLLGQYTISIYNGNPLLNSITVQDATPDQATLVFSRALKAELTVTDFSGLTIDGRHVAEVLSIESDTVIVRMDKPFAPLPNGKLAAAYVPAGGNGGVTASEGVLELQVPVKTGNDVPGDRITETNNIIPLELVTAYVDGDQLKLVFNKPIDGDAADLDLSGLAFGGVVVQQPYYVAGHLVTVRLPQGATSNVLTYADDGPSNIQHANNPFNKLKDVAGLDLGNGRNFINPNAKLVGNELGLKNGSQPIAYAPDFDADKPNGYRTTVPYAVSNIQLGPVPASPTGTIRKVALNGNEVVDLTNLPLREGINTIHINVYDENHPEILLGQYEIIVFREYDDSDSGSGGPSVPSVPSVPQGPKTEIIEVDVVIGGDNAADITRVPIKRTTNNDGTISDQVTYTKEKAEETVGKALEKGESIARVVIPDPKDIVSEVNVDVPI